MYVVGKPTLQNRPCEILTKKRIHSKDFKNLNTLKVVTPEVFLEVKNIS